MPNLNSLLQEQINKYLPVDITQNTLFKDFFEAISDSYENFEREKKIIDITFVAVEKEYEIIYEKLKNEHELKKESIRNLEDSLQKLDENYQGIKNDIDTDDLLFISKYIREEIFKKNETEKDSSRNIELLESLLANLQSGILVEDENQKILFTNQLYCDMFSIFFNPEMIEFSGCTNLAETSGELFVNPDAFKERMIEILDQRIIVTNELLETIDHHFYERDYIPIFIGDEHKGHLWKYTDVTQRIITQSLLEQSEIRSNLIMNSSLNGIINIDSNENIIFWNNQAENIFGWKKEEVLGRNLSETVFYNQHIDFHNNAMNRYLETGEVSTLNKQIELSALNKQGNEFPIEIAVIPIKQGSEIFFCSFIQDISERKKAESSLKHQEEKYRNIIANVNLGLIEIDIHETIQYVNQSFAAMSGYDTHELIGKKTTDFFDYGLDFDSIKSKMESKKQIASELYQFPIINKRGKLKWWALSLAPNFDDNGKLVGSIEIHLDITKQKQMEIDLESEKIKAENASIAKEAFLANMSHEIRTPLNAIIGFLRELEKQELTEIQQKHVRNSSIASKHLLAIINNILDISKIEAGEMPLEDADFVLEDSLKKVTTILLPKAEKKGLIITTIISAQINKVLRGDSLRLEQILFNLIGNSLKFTTKGYIKINCEIIEENDFSQGLRISISDSGIGMDKEFIDTIFKKFSQEDKAITRKFGGTGLGMAITKELVNLMNGEIEVESQKNKGTTIHLHLTFKKGDAKNLIGLQTENKITRIDNISVLLVEDNEMNRMVAQNSLSYFNCIVKEAQNGKEAIEVLKNQAFDIILMDIQMPEMDGIETTKIIRDELNLSTPIIALTANAFKTEINKCRKAGMNDYVTKPFDELQLIETIAKHTVNSNDYPLKTGFDTSKLLYNLKSLSELSRGDTAFISKMIVIFVEQMAKSIDSIDKAIAINDLSVMKKIMHKIKPSIENLSIDSIIDDIKHLEKISETDTIEKEQNLIVYQKVKETLKIVVQQLQENELKI